MVCHIWDFFESLTKDWETPICQNNPSSWVKFYKLYPSHSNAYSALGHWTQASWEIRQNIKIVEIFAYFWGCRQPEELRVSFDGLSFRFPPEITKRGWNRGKTWLHTDQSFTTNKFKCLQSFITGLNVNEHDATLTFMEGSNQYHEEFRHTFNVSDKSDRYKLNKEQESFYIARNCSMKNQMFKRKFSMFG